MKLLYLILIGIFCFGLILVGGKKFRSSALYTLAIGGAINANFFHANAYPIVCFGLPFGIDSIIYTLFIFCLLVMYLKYNKKSAYVLLLSTLAGIVFASIIQFVAEIASVGFSVQSLRTFANFLTSTAASFVASYIMFYFVGILKKKRKNVYAILFIAIVVATIVNSIIYYGVSTLIYWGVAENFWKVLLASFIGKMFALGLSLATYALLNYFEDLKKQEKDNLIQEEKEPQKI